MDRKELNERLPKVVLRVLPDDFPAIRLISSLVVSMLAMLLG